MVGINRSTFVMLKITLGINLKLNHLGPDGQEYIKNNWSEYLAFRLT